MHWVQYWYSCFAVDYAYDVCRISMQRDFTLYIEELIEMANLKDFSDVDRQLLVAAIDLAIGSCERRRNRVGETAEVKQALDVQAERYRALRGSVVMTK